MKIKNNSYMPFIGKLFPLFLMLLFVNFGWGQVNINPTTPYAQNFNSLTTAGTWSNNTTLSGWYARTTATASITTFALNTGSTTTGGLYSYGLASNADRSLGYATSNGFTGAANTGKNYLGLRLKNNSGNTISTVTITYDGEQWRNDNAAAQSLEFSYKIESVISDISTGTFTSVSGLKFTSPKFGGTAGLLDGNLAENGVVSISATINVTILDGEEILLRWEDVNDSGNDHQFAIDNVAVSVASSPSNTAPVVSSVSITGSANTGVQLAGSYSYTDTENNPDTSTFRWYTATDNSGTGAVAIGGATAINYTLTTNELGKYIRLGVTAASSAGTSPGIEAFSSWIGPVTTSSSPTLSTGTLSDFGATCLNVTSAAKSFSLTGTNLTGNVSVGPLTGFVFSQTENGTYTSTLSISPVSNAINAIIYVKFTPTAVQSYNGNISISGGGASAVNIGTVASGINTPATATTGNSAVTSTTANLAGSLTQGCSSITAYGIVYSTTAGFVTGTSVPATNLSAGSFNLVVSALQSNTTYYYKAYATDAIGTVYGTQSSFQTTTIGAPGANATVTSTGFTATWNAVPGATSYELDVYEKTAGSVATDLFISEYVEGSSNNKYIEIFNGTGASVDLSNYQLLLFNNGAATASTTQALSGTLANNGVVVYKNSGANLAGTTSFPNGSSVAFNGDDAVALYKVSTGSNVDVFGRIGDDPGTAWTGAGGYSTLDKTLVRKSSVTGGITTSPAGTGATTFTTLTTEWDLYIQDDVSHLGSHTMAGGSTNTYVFQNQNVGNVLSYVVTGLNPSTHYFYVVRAKDANSTSANSNEIEVTTLNFNDLTTYSAGSWDNGTPTATLNAVINDNYTTTGNLTAKSLTINQGKVFTVGSGHTLTVTNAIVNNSVVAGVDTFVMQNNAVLIQNSESSNTGTFTVKRNSADLYRLDYTLWSSPVSGQNLRSFSPATLFNRFYTYDTAAGTNGDYFQEIVTPADVNSKVFQVAKGYLIRMPNNWVENVNSNSAQPYLGAFRGNLNNGNLSIALSSATTKFNLVGNPYPSPISISAFFTANPDIEKTLYFWRKQNGANLSSGYATCNQLGVVTSDQTAVNGIDLFNTIKAGQGFFVKNNTAATLNFNNAMRTSAGGTFFFKSGTTDENQVHRFWLNLSNETSVVGQTLVGYTSGATQGVDAGLDALYFNDSPLALTTIINNEEYIIQGRSLPFVNTDVVPLGFKTNEAGTFTISLANFDGVFAENQDIYLKDNVTNTVQNLKTASYSFNAGAGVFNDRFEVQYYSALGTSNPELGGNNILIAVKNQQININAGSVVMNKIELIDISGRVIFTQENVNATTATIDNLTAANQMLIVRITTKENAVVNQKIVF